MFGRKCVPEIMGMVFILIVGCRPIPSVKQDFYPDGKLKSEYRLINGKREGLMKGYNEEGKLTVEVNFKMGKQEGAAILFYENGNPYKKALFHDGIQEDSAIEYYPNGKVSVISFAFHGKQTGKYVKFYPNGNIQQIGALIDGINEGWWRAYDSNGHINIVSFYKNGMVKGVSDSNDFRFRNVDIKKCRMQMLIPANWNIDYDIQKGVFLFAVRPEKPPKDSLSTSINLITDTIKRGESLSKDVDENIRALEVNNEIISVVKRQVLMVNGKESEELLIIGKFGNKKGVSIQGCIMNGNQVYILTFVTSISNFPYYPDLMLEIIRSVKFY